MRDAMYQMSDATPQSYDYGLSPEGRAAMLLGLIALILGFGAVAAGAYVGLFTSLQAIELPGGFAAADRGLVAMVMSGCGALTTLLGGISLYKAQEM